MNFEQELNRVAELYTGKGYRVTVHPKPEDLPEFAKDFDVEIVGRRGNDGVLVAVKKNRDEIAADSRMPGYAEITGGQPAWRFDFVILQGEHLTRPRTEAREFSGEDINKVLTDAAQMAGPFIRAAVVTAWAGLEAAMRSRLRAAGENVGWGTMSREMANELYSSGVLSAHEFHQVEEIYQLRNEIVHGFSSPTPHPESVQFLSDLARRLLAESQRLERQPA